MSSAAEIGISVSVDDVLANSKLSEEFRSWARGALCYENIAFFDAVIDARAESDPAQRLAKIIDISETFLVRDAPEIINIDELVRKSTLDRISKTGQSDPNALNQAFSDVKLMIEHDMLPKFLKQRAALMGPLKELPRDDGDADHLSVALHAHLRHGHGHGPAHGHASNGTSTKKAHELDPEEVDLSDAIVDANGDAHIPFTLENYKSEVWRVIKLAAPISGAYLSTMTIGFVNILLLGRLGKVELAAAALSNMYCNVTGLSIGIGLLSAMDTLCSQAFGAGNLKRVGLIGQRGIAILLVLCLPIFFVWNFSEQILLALHQDPDIARLCGTYSRWLFPGLPPLFVFESLKRYLQSQSITAPIMIVSAVCAGLSFPLGWLLIFVLKLGYIGAPIASATLWTLMPILLAGYIRWRGDWHETWPTFVFKDVFSVAGWIEFFKFGLPGAAMTCAEWWCFEFYALMAGWISTLALAIQTVLMTTTSMFFMIPLGLSTAMGTLVGNRLGANQAAQAHFSSKVSMSFAISLQLLLAVGLFVLRDVWGRIFNDEDDVIQGVAYYLPYTCLSVFSDGMQGCMAGILRGSGLQNYGAAINLICYYLIGMPIAYSLAFPADWKTAGLWSGFATGSYLVVGAYIYLILRSDWNALAAQAVARSAGDGSAAGGLVDEDATSSVELSSVNFSKKGNVDSSDGEGEQEKGYAHLTQIEN